MHSVFANCSRHNGLEAWRRIAEPINGDQILILKNLLPLVMDLRLATSLDDFDQALEVWDTNLRLLRAAGGAAPNPEQKRLTFDSLCSRRVSGRMSLCIWTSHPVRHTLH